MSKKKNNDFSQYTENEDFSIYDIELEESVQESRRARREATKKRKVKKANVVKVEHLHPDNVVFESVDEDVHRENNNIKIKSVRARRKTTNKKGKKVKIVSVRATENTKKTKKNSGCLAMLLKTVLVFICLVIIVVGGFYCWLRFFADKGTDWEVGENFDIGQITQPIVGEVPDRTIVLLMITDEDKTRTDSMILANYDNVNGKLTMMSLPRDIIVEVSDENFRIMRSEFPEPGRQYMKFNQIHHYGGEVHGVELLLDEIKRNFDIVPDYYVKVDFDGFNYIVNSIGGVDFEVPQDMDYEDPTQDLYIHLKKGMQHLDGDKAQQLVRFRKDNYGHGYANGDIERIKVQQAFIKTFMQKALSSDAIFKNVFNYMTAFNKYVTTNATVSDMARYASVLKSLNMENVTTVTLPSIPSNAHEITGYEVLEDEAERTIYNIFKKPLDEVKQDIETEKAEADLEKSNDKSIQVLNGGYTDGMAREIMARFNEKDIQVKNVGTYKGTKSDKTIIYVSRDGIGLDLVKFFYNGADVVTDTTKTTDEGYDIVVVVGINEPLKKGDKPITNEFENNEPEYIVDTEQDESYDIYSDDYNDDDSYDYDDYDDEDEDEDYNYDYEED